MNEKQSTSKADPARHIVQEGVVYVDVDGTLTRNYVVLGGVRTYVHAKAGSKLTKDQADAATKTPKAAKK